MPDNTNITIGSLILKELPELLCYTDFPQFVKDMPNLFAVSVPNTVTNVIVSNVQPTNSQTFALWIRQSNSGSFIGIYVFAQGLWRQILPAPQEIFWLYGSSENPPDGFTNTNNVSGTTISVALATALSLLWIAGDKTPPDHEYYSAVFVGF